MISKQGACESIMMELVISKPPEVFLGKRVLKICSKFTGKHPCQSVTSNDTSAWGFSFKFAAYFQNTFSYEHLRRAASASWKQNFIYKCTAPLLNSISHYEEICNLNKFTANCCIKCHVKLRFMISTYNSYFEFSLFDVLEIKNVFQKLGLNDQLRKKGV